LPAVNDTDAEWYASGEGRLAVRHGDCSVADG
jgi:hypothetical protein